MIKNNLVLKFSLLLMFLFIPTLVKAEEIVIKESDSVETVTVDEKEMKQVITYPDQKDFDFLDHIETEKGASYVFIGKVNLSKEGEGKIVVLKIKKDEEPVSTSLLVKVVSKDDYTKMIEEKEKVRKAEEERQRAEEIARRAAAQKAALERQARMIAQMKAAESGDMNAIADSLLGSPGLCDTVASRFLQLAFGYGNVRNSYVISSGEAQPGDIIYYADNHHGGSHWAIYLGGNKALHGNFNGTTMYHSAYSPYLGEPQFRRLNGR